MAALAAAGATLIAGCQAGQHAQTAQTIPTIDGASAQIGSLGLRDVTIEYPETGSWPPGSDARLHLVVVNVGRAADTLVEVRTAVADSVELNATPGATPEPTTTATPEPSQTGSATPTGSESPSESPSESESTFGPATPSPTHGPSPTEEAATGIPIPGPGLVSFGEEGPEIVLTGLTRELRPAQVVPITFVFAEAGEVTVIVAVATPLEEVEPAPTVPTEGEAGAAG